MVPFVAGSFECGRIVPGPGGPWAAGCDGFAWICELSLVRRLVLVIRLLVLHWLRADVVCCFTSAVDIYVW